MTAVIQPARSQGVSAYVDDGLNRWSAAHVSDTARLYRPALEKHQAGARHHTTAEQGIAFRQIAEAVGTRLGLPVKRIARDAGTARFGWLAAFVNNDMSASSAKTRERLSWRPSGPGLLADLANLAG